MSNPMNALLETADWKEVPPPESSEFPDLPHVTHEGRLTVAGFEFRCYQLSNGQGVFDATDVEAFFSNFPT